MRELLEGSGSSYDNILALVRQHLHPEPYTQAELVKLLCEQEGDTLEGFLEGLRQGPAVLKTADSFELQKRALYVCSVSLLSLDVCVIKVFRLCE
jgi:hypothetical protein